MIHALVVDLGKAQKRGAVHHVLTGGSTAPRAAVYHLGCLTNRPRSSKPAPNAKT